ncbi:polysaccharide pyruvyl transferase family protein [Azospira restricta]|uniref:Polysaccharide pyruvyl transferase family protein n=1 Tax=Azospira restricta TaxID=404405 RepID=A0A974PVF3_9RHOO|nr:polysaccharide pyruvyl transferase family protein [Azospira restricta]QRJ62248.1 polysaccharide pyruvyl transferase family protein [Azospira restricta]
MEMTSATPLVLFGACDRHNLGDLLLAEVAARRAAPRPCLFAGLRAADLRAVGGRAVAPIGELIAQWPRRFGAAPLEVLHVGGEVLDTDAWEAAVMLLPAAEAASRIAALDRRPRARAAWAAEFLGCARRAPYVLAGDAGIATAFRAVGGVGLAQRPPAFRREIAAALRAARAVTVRDRATQAALAAEGVAAGLEPDPVAQAADLLAELVAGAPRAAGDYLAVQCAADFADDATLAALAGVLDASGLPVRFFAAGLAPWHDDLALYRRLAARLRVPAAVVGSAAVRDTCALIAGARGCLASSLHALLVAGAFAVPALGLAARPGGAAKLWAYAATWGGFEVAAVAELAGRRLPLFRA